MGANYHTGGHVAFVPMCLEMLHWNITSYKDMTSLGDGQLENHNYFYTHKQATWAVVNSVK